MVWLILRPVHTKGELANSELANNSLFVLNLIKSMEASTPNAKFEKAKRRLFFIRPCVEFSERSKANSSLSLYQSKLTLPYFKRERERMVEGPSRCIEAEGNGREDRCFFPSLCRVAAWKK